VRGIRRGKGQIVLHAVMIVLSLCYILPFMMMVSVSLTEESAIAQRGYSLIPPVFSAEAYRRAFNNPAQILDSYRVTILFTVTTTALSTLIMGLMAYPLARPNFRLKGIITFLVFFTMLFSGGLVPSYIVNTKYLHLRDSLWVYVLPSLVSAWNVLIIRTNYKQLPDSLIESAKIDGASELRICLRIVMPLSLPVMATIAFLTFVAKWNEWSSAMVYIRNPRLYSLQYLLQRILREAEYMKTLAERGDVMADAYSFPTESFRYAMAMLAAGPVLAAFPFFQKYFARGLTIGAVKG
jgi:putative aldouronate transport system permease protein